MISTFKIAKLLYHVHIPDVGNVLDCDYEELITVFFYPQMTEPLKRANTYLAVKYPEPTYIISKVRLEYLPTI